MEKKSLLEIAELLESTEFFEILEKRMEETKDTIARRHVKSQEDVYANERDRGRLEGYQFFKDNFRTRRVEVSLAEKFAKKDK